MTTIDNPCHHCSIRHFKCHADCPDYKAFKDELAKHKQEEAERKKKAFLLLENDYRRFL